MKRVIYVLVLIISAFILSNTINAWSEYSIGQEVEYNGINFYVIKDSSTKEDSVTMLKAEPLSYEKVQIYSAGTGVQTINQNGYGGMKYHSESNSYLTSYVRTTVEAWAQEEVPAASEARLLVGDDFEELGYEMGDATPSDRYWMKTDNVPSWVYNSNYWYWTMDPKDDASIMWNVNGDGILGYKYVFYYNGVVRPVITLSKIALGDTNDIESDETENKNTKEIIPDKQENNKKESSTKVRVANTYMKTPIIIILLGFIIAGIGIFIYYKLSNKKK